MIEDYVASPQLEPNLEVEELSVPNSLTNRDVKSCFGRRSQQNTKPPSIAVRL
jgi:hypothetical protein